MSSIWADIAGGFIVVMMITFIGIWIWAWNKRHKATFDHLAQLPMEDELGTAKPPEDRT